MHIANAGWLAAALALSGCASTGAGATPAAPPGAVAPAAAAAVAVPTVEPLEDANAFRACQTPAKRKEILLDTASRRLLQTVCGASLWFDGLFGERDLDAAQRSYGRVEVSTAYSQFKGAEYHVRFDAHVKLPALQERVSAFFGRDDEEAFVRDRTEGQALRSRTRTTDRDEFLTGLGFVVLTTDRFQSDFKVGARNLRQPAAFVRNRFSWIPYSNSQNRVVIRITPFWDTRIGTGVTTSTAFDRVIEEAFLLRWSNAATFSQSSPGLDWRTAAVLYQNLVGTSALAYEVFVRGATRASEPIGEYGFRNVYRRPILTERLYGELVLGYTWPRDDPRLDRYGTYEVGLGIEMPFGIAPK